MDSYLSQLRKKPEHVRRRVVFGATTAIGLALFGFWTLQFQSRLQDGSAANTASAYSPIRSINETIKGSIGEVKLYSQEFIKGFKQ